MAQKYRIYINEKVVLITESEPKNVSTYEKLDAQSFDLRIIYTWIVRHHNKLFYVQCPDAKAYMKSITAQVPLIEAAGGLVKNDDGHYLFIYRHEKWDLPKGKIEKNEKVKVAAVREVEEECGITVSKLGDKICKTYHVYTSKGDVVLKKTHWFAMKYKGNEKLKPQLEEGITDVRWFKPNLIGPITDNTFPSIIDVLVKKKLIEEKEAPLSE